MNTMNTIYKTLIEKHATSEALFAHLRASGLSIAMPEFTAENPVAIIHNNKGRSGESPELSAAFRSVVWDPRTNRPLCVSPASSTTLAEDNFPSAAEPPSILVENFVDGVMVNLFQHAGTWRLATRTRIDADSSFYGPRSFAELFWETFHGAGLNKEQLDGRFCYSWVLQHPEERVVVAPQYGIPKLHLVEMYRVNAEDGAVEQIVGAAGMREHLRPVMHALLPEVHELRSFADVKARVEAWGRRFGAQWQGLVVKSGGQRWKLRSAEYTAARVLRGNQANRTYHWFELWGEHKLEDYLRIFPEERSDAETVVERFKACTQELHDIYQQVYRRREFPLGKAPQKYRKLLWEAHQANAGAYFPALRRFMNGQDTARKVWLVNYERRYGAPIDAAGDGGDTIVVLGEGPDGKLSCGCDSAKHDCVA